MKEHKKIRNWFRTNLNLNTILLLVLIIIVAIDFITRSVLLDRSRLEIKQLRSQVAYLQDTVNIVQTDVSNLETNIEATLEQESSLLEAWSITPCSANFADNTYDLRIVLTPKTYTDTTKASIFFGAKEYLLNQVGHNYEGMVTLPLDENYDNNVTVLFADGTRKTTEVLSGYNGIQTRTRNVLTGSLGRLPSNTDGLLKADTSVHYSLNANTCFNFDNLMYVIQIDGEDRYCYDLIADEEMENTEISHDKTYHLASESGEADTRFETQIEPDQKVCILLRATTDNGFLFEYELFSGYSDMDGNGFAESFTLYESHYTIIDNHGGKWNIY